jgi:hypothetical protein
MLGIDALFGTAVEGDVGKDPDVTAVWLSQPNLGLSTKVLSLSAQSIALPFTDFKLGSL